MTPESPNDMKTPALNARNCGSENLSQSETMTDDMPKNIVRHKYNTFGSNEQ
jgi:hypothetical protein